MTTSLTASIKPQFRTIDGLRIRYADSGGSHEPTLLLTSPWPESMYAFAPMWATLAEHARLFAVDLPGFGASERRDDLLSPRAMGGFLARLIAEADLGTAAHRRAGRRAPRPPCSRRRRIPERIASVIVGTGGAAVPLELGEPLRSWVLDPDLDKYRRDRSARRSSTPRWTRSQAGSPTTSAPTTSPATTATASSSRCATCAGTRRSCLRSPSCCRRSRRRSRSSTAATTASSRSPTPSSSTSGCPTAASRIIDAGHFVWEEAPAEYASIILDSIAGSDS